MFIYNVTVKVDTGIADEWLQWMKEKHIPEVMQTGCFTKHHIILLLEIDDTDGPTYAIQYHANTMNDYTNYINKYAEELRQKTFNEWGNKVFAFRTLMKIVQ